MTSEQLKDAIVAAINGAIATTGKNKGKLKASRPNSSSDAAAAWEALIMASNPYKASVFFQIMMNERQQAIFKELSKAIDGLDVRGLDRDRVALEALGVW